MAARSSIVLEPRKTPVQERSAVTVEAILEATVQVLLELGPERLTTVRVAQRAGVSVGTLYQYYPNKQSLLFSLLDQHLANVGEAVEKACQRLKGQPLPVMVAGLVGDFMEAKLKHKDVSLALYRIAADVGGDKVIARLTTRANRQLGALFSSAPELGQANVTYPAFLFFEAMRAGARSVLEAGAGSGAVRELKEQLVLMGCSYLAAAAGTTKK